MKTVLITGASSGVGQALALAVARKKWRLILCGRSRPRLDDVAMRCRGYGAEVHERVIVTLTDEMRQWIIDADNAFADIAIANAGISGGSAGLSGDDFEDQTRRIFSVNIDGVLNTICPLLPRMAERGSGQLISSMASFHPQPGAPAYSASKAAIRFLGEALQKDYARSGVAITVICPGFIKTPMTDVNSFPMPFTLSAEDCAERMIRAIEKRQAFAAFPLSMYIMANLPGLLPLRLRNAFLYRLPRKTAFKSVK